MERRHLLLLDASLPLIVGAVIVLVPILHGGTIARPLPLVVGIAAALTLAARHRAPGWTLTISGGLVLYLVHLDAAAGAIAVLAPAVALYSVALTRGRVEQLCAAVAAVAAVIVADTLHTSHLSVIQILAHVTLVAIPLLAAETHRTRHSHVSLLVERRVEQERMRIARDLHDVVAHTLTAINVQSATAAQLLDRSPEHTRAALETIEDASRVAIAELRAILGVLRDRDQADEPRSPAPGVQNVTELVERARDSGLDVQFEVSGVRPERLSDTVSLAAYRIVQESLTNANATPPELPSASTSRSNPASWPSPSRTPPALPSTATAPPQASASPA